MFLVFVRLMDPPHQLSPPGPTAVSGRRFKIGLSFPGEKRDYVRKVADKLREQYGEQGILYDDYHRVHFACKSLDQFLPPMYRDDCELVVVFLCKDYIHKRWCQLEWRHIQALIKDLRDAKRVMFYLCDDNIDFSGLDGFDPNVDGSLPIGNKRPAIVATEILERLAPILQWSSPFQQYLPTPPPAPAKSWIFDRLDQFAAEFCDLGKAALSRSFRRSFRQVFPTKTLASIFPPLVRDFSWDDLRQCFTSSDCLNSFPDERLQTFFQHWRAAIGQAGVMPAKAVLAILVERPDGSSPPAAGSFLASYAFKSVLVIEGEDQSPSFLPLPHPGSLSSRVQVAFPPAEQPSGSEDLLPNPPANCIWPSQMIAELMHIARLRLSEQGYDTALIIDLFLPVELLDFDWSGGVQLPDGLDGTDDLRQRDYRLRSLNRWISFDMSENREKLAEKHARFFRDDQDCFAWLACDHGFAAPLFRGLQEVARRNDLLAVVSLDAAPRRVETRLQWYKQAIKSAAPLVGWLGRSGEPVAEELSRDLLAALENRPFPRLENPDPACNLRRHRCGDDPARLASSKCGCPDHLVVLFDAPLATRAGELQPRLFLEADGGNLLAASP